MIYETERGCSISSGGMWLPGIYDSKRTARYAFRFPNGVLQSLSDRICRFDSENRVITITMDDLRAAKAGSQGLQP